jgi:diaminopimelate epimerase
VAASALISARVHRFGSPVRVQVQGGDQLEVSFKDSSAEFSEVRLTGPADFVFDGTVKV